MLRSRFDTMMMAIWVVCSAGCGEVPQSNIDGSVDTAMLPDSPAIDAPPMIDAAVDAAPDAAPDAPAPVTRYDVGYVNDFTLAPSDNSVSGFLVVVNTGTKPLDLGTATVRAFSDDDATVEWSFTKAAGATLMLGPGRAAGSLTTAAKSLVLVGDVVAEPIDDETLDFSMVLPSTPDRGTTVHAQAVMRIDDVDATLSFVIHIAPGQGAELNSARRVSARP
jgi:hypothetical protein